MITSNSAIQSCPAFDTKAVPPEVVVAARRTYETARWICLQPALALATVPDAIFGPEHPPTALAVKHRQVANRDTESPCLQAACAALLDEVPVAQLCLSEWIDCHSESIACGV